jgi:hypothetical protein
MFRTGTAKVCFSCWNRGDLRTGTISFSAVAVANGERHGDGNRLFASKRLNFSEEKAREKRIS